MPTESEEDKVYEAICKDHGCTSDVLSKKCGVEISTLTSCIKSLLNQGLIRAVTDSPEKFYPTEFSDLFPKRLRARASVL
jgi:predicted transcriptional regulator